MHNATPPTFTILRRNRLAIGLLIALAGAGAASAHDLDFSNPAVGITGDAVFASGTCIAKYTAQLDDSAQPAAAVARLVADRCQKQIARSAGLSALLAGKPDDFAKDLKYAREELTANAVVRHRAATQKVQVAELR